MLYEIYELMLAEDEVDYAQMDGENILFGYNGYGYIIQPEGIDSFTVSTDTGGAADTMNYSSAEDAYNQLLDYTTMAEDMDEDW